MSLINAITDLGIVPPDEENLPSPDQTLARPGPNSRMTDSMPRQKPEAVKGSQGQQQQHQHPQQQQKPKQQQQQQHQQQHQQQPQYQSSRSEKRAQHEPQAERGEATSANVGPSKGLGQHRPKRGGSSASTDSSGKVSNAGKGTNAHGSSNAKRQADTLRVRIPLGQQASVKSFYSSMASFDSAGSGGSFKLVGQHNAGEDEEDDCSALEESGSSNIFLSSLEVRRLLNRKTLAPRTINITLQEKHEDSNFQPYLLESLHPMGNNIANVGGIEEAEDEDEEDEDENDDEENDEGQLGHFVSTEFGEPKLDNEADNEADNEVDNEVSGRLGTVVATQRSKSTGSLGVSMVGAPGEGDKHDASAVAGRHMRLGRDLERTHSCSGSEAGSSAHGSLLESSSSQALHKLRNRRRDHKTPSIGRAVNPSANRGWGTGSQPESCSSASQGPAQAARARMRERIYARATVHKRVQRARQDITLARQAHVTKDTACLANITPKQQERINVALEKLARKRRKQRSHKLAPADSRLSGLASHGSLSIAAFPGFGSSGDSGGNGEEPSTPPTPRWGSGKNLLRARSVTSVFSKPSGGSVDTLSKKGSASAIFPSMKTKENMFQRTRSIWGSKR
ncbi:Hypothetical Protein FCC1311_086952 [Hondaea fermentalgiana]|uniref:Uncharacterized protein n=1 Tax=Hondaea fermentalgiana TaxID=2315210 RepID=A0A2R5GNL1_9STRA|nr:Hypothetical Protein FCC1311_086952 [Hondaea fermentalgiana]|eukprot:GBG32470.1 Hypothetical Protein FCC1311_086952 [Hondaea fermentalgiana]